MLMAMSAMLKTGNIWMLMKSVTTPYWNRSMKLPSAPMIKKIVPYVCHSVSVRYSQKKAMANRTVRLMIKSGNCCPANMPYAAPGLKTNWNLSSGVKGIPGELYRTLRAIHLVS